MSYEEERKAHKEPVDMTISSKVPSKWRFVDMETGQVWKWDEERETFTAARDLRMAEPPALQSSDSSSTKVH